MDFAGPLLARASELDARNESSSGGRPVVYKAVGISLAVASGVFIGVSFVLKKTGLLKANVKYNEEAGEGYGYLKNFWWWTGMTLMILGEICNFVAYAFVDAILVTPLGALSVVITTILSAIFLKERLSFVGKVGCFCCIIGSVVIAMNAPQQSSVDDIQEMKDYVITPGFLTYAGIIVVGCAITAIWAGPRYGKRSMFVYISICSLIGGLSVVATQGLGAAILAQINGKSQFKEWFLYVLLVFVIATLLTEIIYLNKALNIFNAALVTPTYYVFFTSATIITSAILFQGFNGSGVEIATVVMGFLQICSGVVLLQLSKSAKDVPDAAVFKGDLDQVREVVTQEEPETEPRADSIRGTAAIIRRISTSRRNMEEQEARRFFNEKREDCRTPPSENEVIEWDGLRRRKTVIGEGPTMSRPRTPGTPGSIKSFPPLGMSHFPTENGHVSVDGRPSSGHHFFEGIRSRASVALHPAHWRQSDKPGEVHDSHPGTMLPVGLDDLHGAKAMDTGYHGAGFEAGRERSSTAHSITWADEVQPDRSGSGENSVVSEPLPHPARRQFSFNNVLSRMRPGGESTPSSLTRPARGILRRTARSEHLPTVRASTEEERLGLVHGDSQDAQVLDDDDVNEKLERTWSSSSESSDGGTRRLVEARPRGLSHQSSASTMSTTPFPHYEEYDPYHPEDHHYVDPSSQGASHGQVDGPQPRSITGHAPRSRMATSSQSRPNPLPPVPDEDLVLAGRTEPSMRVELRSSGHSRSGSETGWRRHGRGRGS